MAKFNKENYILVPGFAITDLGLQGNELLIFSLIHGFSQDGNSVFKGSLSYTSSALNCSKPTVINVLKKLCDRNFIIRKENEISGILLVSYTINPNVFTGSKDSLPLVKKFHKGSKEILQGGKDSLPNNILYTTYTSIKDNTNVLSKKKYSENDSEEIPSELTDEKTFQKKVAPKTRFSIPLVEEVRAYCQERQNSIDAEKFHNHYTSVGWKVGKSPMKDWQSAVRNWEKNSNNKANHYGTQQQPEPERFIGRQSQQQIIDALEREQACSYDPRFRE